VASGASGAIILGTLGYGSYLRPEGKPTGPLWRELEVAQIRKYVAIVDDCIFTGATVHYIYSECIKAGLEVVRVVTLMDRSAERNLPALSSVFA
jgi:hypoxanthine-guanine phosphoribosyltransferase